MARTTQDIRRSISEAFIADPTIQQSYHLTPGKTFEEQFSKVSLEAILFWVFASAIHALEELFDLHRKDVAELVAEAEPHTLRWYAIPSSPTATNTISPPSLLRRLISYALCAML